MLPTHKLLAGLVLWVGGALVLAQVWTNTQVNMRARTQVTGNPNGSVRYSTPVKLLESEERYANYRSGALPSEIRMAGASVGPLSPTGSIAYVPGQSPVQQAMRLPPNQLYNPAYGISGGGGGAAPPPPIALASIAPSSIRYATPAPNSVSNAITPANLNTTFSTAVAPPVLTTPSMSGGASWGAGMPSASGISMTAPATPSAYPQGQSIGSIRYSGLAK